MNKNKSDPDPISPLQGQVALITGGAKRLGACIASTLHAAGMNVVIHYHSSSDAATALQKQLLAARPDSAVLVQADITQLTQIEHLINATIQTMGRLDVLVNNASNFYPTPLMTANEEQWQHLMDSNLKAPFFLTQAAAPHLTHSAGSVINIVDIYADRPLKDHPIYAATKAGLVSLTKSFAQSLAPDVRVNGIAPGAILWPENDTDEDAQQQLLSRTPLKRIGDPLDIAKTVLFLTQPGGFVNGQIISVDGGRTVIP